MSSIGLVLGGGAVTGAAFHFGALFSLQMATGWDPASADVIVGTSSGAVVAAILRGSGLSIEALVGDAEGDQELSEALSNRIYRRSRPRGVVRWLRHGVVPGLRRPGLQLTLGCPAAYSTDGLAAWLHSEIGDLAEGWPDRPTIIVAYELEGKRRVAFGTEAAPDAGLARAVAASSAMPMVFEPVRIDGSHYLDGGMASGTNTDLVLGAARPLDLIIVIAPLASMDIRSRARFYESAFDRRGADALAAEIEVVKQAWPDTQVLVLRPTTEVLESTRPNPLSTRDAVPAFMTTLETMQSELSRPGVWSMLERHLVTADHC